ncbi:CSC1-like protein RXW8 [Linum perenne]
MEFAALLTSAGINIALFVLLLTLYSVLRKQPSNRIVYFGRLASLQLRKNNSFSLERFVPCTSWLHKAWKTTQDEMLTVGGLDAVVFQRLLVFSIRIFSIATFICVFLVLPVNYYGKEMKHKPLGAESLDVFTIGNVDEGSAEAERVCSMISSASSSQRSLKPFCFCSSSTLSFRILEDQPQTENVEETIKYSDFEIAPPENERPVAFVFFKTRYAAVVATQMLQSENPMLWVTEAAPEPLDVLWSSLSIPYKQLWLRKIATLLTAIVFMFLFLPPVTFVQGLTQLEKLSKTFPFLRGLLKKPYINHVVTGYLPSVILMLFLLLVPPMMMLLSTIEAPISRSGRTKSACLKILYFTIWNVFFVNVLSGSIISQLNVFSSVRDIPQELARAIPTQASFFMTYVFTSGWAGLACELMQLFTFICNLFKKFILRNHQDTQFWLMSFPYHTEIPRVLLFALLGFTCSIMAPLILPFLLIYFFMAYLIYRNQDSPVASGFTIPLIICTLLYSAYSRQRFLPVFRKHASEVLIDMDRDDENGGRLEDMYNRIRNAYCQIQLATQEVQTVSHPADMPEIITSSSEDTKLAFSDDKELGLVKVDSLQL